MSKVDNDEDPPPVSWTVVVASPVLPVVGATATVLLVAGDGAMVWRDALLRLQARRARYW